MSKKKLIALILAAAMTATMLAGCSGKNEADTPVTIAKQAIRHLRERAKIRRTNQIRILMTPAYCQS